MHPVRPVLAIAAVLTLVGSASARAAAPEPLPADVSPTLSAEVAKFRPVHMPFDRHGRSARELRMLDKLVAATRLLDEVYWEQIDPEGHALYLRLADDPRPLARDLRRFLRINGSRYDLIANDAPFVGHAPHPPGRNFYPPDLTHEEFDRYVAAHPAEREALTRPLTVVRRDGQRLVAVPYHVAYAKWLRPMSTLLDEAAALADDPAFAKFLKLRAQALLTDDYFPSDLAWLDLDNPKVDLIFAPYETYLDDLLGVKASYGAAVLLRDEAGSRELDLYRRHVPGIQDALPLAPADRPSKQGLRTPMEVVDAPFRGGDLRHGYQAVADNLPNDPRVHEQKGSKKLFFKNFMDARVQYVILPIALRLLRPDQATLASAHGYFTTTVMHEIAHGLGPAFARTTGGRRDIREAIGPVFSALEEAKADIVGLYGLHYLVEHGVVPKADLDGYYVSALAGIFRSVRFGVAEAHGRAEMMEFNFLAERGAIVRDVASGRYSLDLAAMPAAVAALARELLEQEATGDRARAERWFEKYGTLPPALAAALGTVADVPVDVDPSWDFPEE
jgi:hypothetical protein